MSTAHTPSKWLTFWARLLTVDIPWVGRFSQNLAVNQIAQAIARDDSRAVTLLVAGLQQTTQASVQQKIVAVLSGILPAACSDQLWEEWACCRHPAIEPTLLSRNEPARPQSPAWAISQAKLGVIHLLQNAAPGRIPEIIGLLADPDPQVAANAKTGLEKCARPDSQSEIFNQWALTRSPDLWNLAIQAGFPTPTQIPLCALVLLKRPEPIALQHAEAAFIPYIVAALTDQDPSIAAEARRCLPTLQVPAAINAFAQIWSVKRTAALEKILIEGRLLATQPYELRLQTALKIGRVDLACDCSAEGVSYVFQNTTDRDPEIAQAARTALLNLSKPEARAALCMLAVNQGEPLALQLALQAGYRPERPEQRAVFVFLAGLIAEYDALDFDQRYLQTFVQTCPSEVRQRIALQVQRSGKTNYLTILAGADYRSRAARLNAGEVQLLIELLISNQEWQRLWALVHTVTFGWAVRILQALSTNAWQPANEPDCTEFDHLARLAAGIIPPTAAAWTRQIPPAVTNTLVRVKGRVNDVCFAPTQPILAFGTGARKLAVWNFQNASLQRVRQGVNHSISRVAFAGDDILLCGVRSNTDAACWIYGWQKEEAFVLPGHRGAVTALEPIDETHLLTAGRDGAIILWDLMRRQEVNRRVVSEWPRRAILSPDRARVALIHSSIALLNLPELTGATDLRVSSVAHSNTTKSISQCGIFLPNEDALLFGQRNGQMVKYTPHPNERGFSRKAVIFGNSAVIGLNYLARRQIVVSASRDGKINFHHWPGLALIGTVIADGGDLTSMQISPDGSYMATGNGESAMQLWDLRVLDLPGLLDLPLAKANADYLAAVTGLLNAHVQAPPLRQTLELLKALLLRRLRFDIQLEELPQIQPGEFDIQLD